MSVEVELRPNSVKVKAVDSFPNCEIWEGINTQCPKFCAMKKWSFNRTVDLYQRLRQGPPFLKVGVNKLCVNAMKSERNLHKLKTTQHSP